MARPAFHVEVIEAGVGSALQHIFPHTSLITRFIAQHGHTTSKNGRSMKSFSLQTLFQQTLFQRHTGHEKQIPIKKETFDQPKQKRAQRHPF
eukprot:834869-Amphidinium_carterae.1